MTVKTRLSVTGHHFTSGCAPTGEIRSSHSGSESNVSNQSPVHHEEGTSWGLKINAPAFLREISLQWCCKQMGQKGCAVTLAFPRGAKSMPTQALQTQAPFSHGPRGGKSREVGKACHTVKQSFLRTVKYVRSWARNMELLSGDLVLHGTTQTNAHHGLRVANEFKHDIESQLIIVSHWHF